MTSKRTPSGLPPRTSPDSKGSVGPARLVGRIVDPSVRHDGRGDPAESVVTAGGQFVDASASALRGGQLFSADQPRPSGHPVRDRLLARAAASATESWAEPSSPSASTSPSVNTAPGTEPVGKQAVSEQAVSEQPGATTELSAVEQPGTAPPEEELAVRGLLGFDSLPGLTDDLDLIGRKESTEQAAPPQEERVPRPLLHRVVVGVAAMAFVFGVLAQGAPREPLTTAMRAADQAVGASRLASAKASPEGALRLLQQPSEGALSVPQEGEQPVAVPMEALPYEPPTKVVRPPRKAHKGPWRIERAVGDPQLQIIESVVGAESFLVSLQGAGIVLKQGFRVLKAFEGVRNFDRCRPREKYIGLLDRETGALKAFEYEVSAEEIYQAQVGEDGLLRGKKLDLQVKHQRARGVLRLRGDFNDSARRGGFEGGLTTAVNKALAGYTTVAQMKSGDVLALIAQEVTVLGDFERYAGIEALEYRRLGEKPLRIYYQDAGKARGYVDAKGRMFGKGRWAKPVKGAPRTSKFNPRRMHPILKVIRPHNGTDYGASAGTPVMAAANARVKFVGKLGPNGNFIRLSHPGGYETGYSHLLRFAKGLKRGARVKQHQVIGYVGSTGRSTGPHLHFSAKKHGKFIDPESLDLDAFARLPVSDRKQLSRLRKRYDQLLAKLDIPEPTERLNRIKPQPLPNLPIASDEVDYVEPVSARRSVTAALLPQVSASQSPSAEAVLLAQPVQPALSVYLSDRELMLQQPAEHNGEVVRP